MEVNNETPSPQEGNPYFAGQTKISEHHLQHFLSPILTAANSAGFEPFTYNFTGYELRIGKELAEELHKISRAELAVCKALMNQVADLLLETNGEHAEFLSTPIKDMNFSTRTYHGLIGRMPVRCSTMLDVAKLGSKRVARLRMIGSKSVEEIRQAFIKAGCIHLFNRDVHEES
jgi:hypothetical protein